MALTTIIIGLFFVAVGVSVFLNPRMQGARDVNLITSAEAGSAERGAAYVVGGILLIAGLAIVSLGVMF